MPRLDVYRQQETASNQLRVIRNARPDEAASEVVGETITAAGELMMRINQARAEQEAANLEIEAGRRFDGLYRELEQDGEADYGEFEKRMTDGSTKLRSELLGKVRSKPVRDAFDLRLKQMETGYVVRTRDLMQRRGVEEVKAGLIGRMASLEDTANDMTVLYDDPDRPESRTFLKERDVVLAEIRSMQEKGFIGKDDAALYKAKVDTLTKKADSDRVLNEIDTRLDRGETASAEEYFKMNYGRVSPDRRESVERVIESKGLEYRAITKADQFWSAANGDYGTAIAEAYKIQNPDERLAVESRLAQLKNQGDAAKAAADQALLEEGMGYIVDGRSLPSDLLRRASPMVIDRLQTEQRTRALWAQQMATLSAEERRAMKEASAISKDYFKSIASIDPEAYLAPRTTWSADMIAEWDRLMPEHQAEIMADVSARQARGQTFDALDATFKDLIAQVPILGPENMRASNLTSGSRGTGSRRTFTDEEKAVRASLYRQAQDHARRTGGAPISAQESRVMIARAFREFNVKRYPFPEPGRFLGQIDRTVAASPVYQETRSYLAEKLGRDPTNEEVMAMMQAMAGD